MLRLMLIASIIVGIAGCGIYTYRVTPDAPTESAALKSGDDCTPVLLGLGAGTLTADAAAKNGGITRVRSVEINQYYVLIAGMHCVTVTGE